MRTGGESAEGGIGSQLAHMVGDERRLEVARHGAHRTRRHRFEHARDGDAVARLRLVHLSMEGDTLYTVQNKLV